MIGTGCGNVLNALAMTTIAGNLGAERHPVMVKLPSMCVLLAAEPGPSLFGISARERNRRVAESAGARVIESIGQAPDGDLVLLIPANHLIQPSLFAQLPELRRPVLRLVPVDGGPAFLFGRSEAVRAVLDKPTQVFPTDAVLAGGCLVNASTREGIRTAWYQALRRSLDDALKAARHPTGLKAIAVLCLVIGVTLAALR